MRYKTCVSNQPVFESPRNPVNVQSKLDKIDNCCNLALVEELILALLSKLLNGAILGNESK